MKKFIKNIVDKKFELVINGYSPSGVDSFLDNVIKKMEEFDKNMSDLKLENENLINENKILKNEITKLQNEFYDLFSNKNEDNQKQEKIEKENQDER